MPTVLAVSMELVLEDGLGATDGSWSIRLSAAESNRSDHFIIAAAISAITITTGAAYSTSCQSEIAREIMLPVNRE
jgi:hypothetical protein